MHKRVVKTGAYLLLATGILFALIVLLSALILIISFPESSLEKKAIVGVGLLITSFFILLLSITGFEALIDLMKTESILEKHFPSELTGKKE